MLKQKTLKDSFSLSGKGLHTGLDLTVTFNPAPDNHGYKIQRIDVEGQPTIDAVADNVTETTRGTVLSKNGVKVSTVEHGMAALYALGIDNCLIQVNGPEFPILDGSAQYYAQEIERVGTEEQNAVKDFYIIKSKIEFRDEKTGSSIIVLPDENFSLNVLVSYDSTIIPNQFATLEDMSKFRDEVAGSRTFVFVREIEPLLQAGLIKGGDLDNAIVIYEREMSQEDFDKLADVMGVPHMDAKQLLPKHGIAIRSHFPSDCTSAKSCSVEHAAGRKHTVSRFHDDQVTIPCHGKDRFIRMLSPDKDDADNIQHLCCPDDLRIAKSCDQDRMIF